MLIKLFITYVFIELYKGCKISVDMLDQISSLSAEDMN